MELYQHIRDKIAYHKWSNDAIVRWLRNQSSDLITKEVRSSFPDLKSIIHHMMEAETYYFSILKGTEARYFDELSNEQVFEKLLETNERLLHWYLNENPEIVEKIISIKRSPYEERYSVATLLSHIVNHGTYHRGQIISLRHQLGISDPPKTDYYWMFAERLLSKK